MLQNKRPVAREQVYELYFSLIALLHGRPLTHTFTHMPSLTHSQSPPRRPMHCAALCRNRCIDMVISQRGFFNNVMLEFTAPKPLVQNGERVSKDGGTETREREKKKNKQNYEWEVALPALLSDISRFGVRSQFFKRAAGNQAPASPFIKA